MGKSPPPIYMDCASTTPVDPRVRDELLRYLDEDFGNAGSRTHDFGGRARAAVEHARDIVSAVAGGSRGDVVFTSGATESNNIAILGLWQYGEKTGRRHIVSTAIEHHAVLAPLAEMARRGFQIQYVRPGRDGAVDADEVGKAIRHDTLLVSIMHVNNETGVIQPIEAVASMLGGSNTFLHVDAAQSFGKEIPALRHPRIDLISVSGHKIHGPKGVGALIARRRDGQRPPLQPLMFGGGQERGWRPGTQPVHLIAGLGRAAELALEECDSRRRRCLEIRRDLLAGLAPLRPVIHGDSNRSVAHILNLSIPGVDSETVIDAWRDIVAISNGAACTSQSYTCSHVLGAMDVPRPEQDGALRLSWCHLTGVPDFKSMIDAIEDARRRHSL